MFRPQDIFYKIKSPTRNNSSFPAAVMSAEFPMSKMSLSFKDTKARFLITVDQTNVTIDEYEYEGTSTSEVIYKLGHPEDSDCNIFIDQDLEDISKAGINKDKVQILKIPTVEARLVALLNALDSAFYHALGVRNVQRGLRVVA